VPGRGSDSFDSDPPPHPLRRLRCSGRICRTSPPIARALVLPLLELLVLLRAPLPGLSGFVPTPARGVSTRVSAGVACPSLRQVDAIFLRGPSSWFLPPRRCLRTPASSMFAAGTRSGVRRVDPASVVGAPHLAVGPPRSVRGRLPCAWPFEGLLLVGSWFCVTAAAPLLPFLALPDRSRSGARLLPHGPKSAGGACPLHSVVRSVSSASSGGPGGISPPGSRRVTRPTGCPMRPARRLRMRVGSVGVDGACASPVSTFGPSFPPSSRRCDAHPDHSACGFRNEALLLPLLPSQGGG